MTKQLLGDIALTSGSFETQDAFFKQLRTSPFQALASRERFQKVNKELLHLIEKEPAPCFLLPHVLHFIDQINKEKFLNEEYTFTQFEFWLNRFSKLSLVDELNVRAKISGRFLPREEYQVMFPIGMKKMFEGSHFVAAHLSPDIDTTIASFWSWVDAVSAKVAQGVHQWSLPGVFPDSHFTYMFGQIFGKNVFDSISRKNTRLTLTAQDLIKQDVQKLHAHTPTSSLTHTGKAIIYVDKDGHYLGDFRAVDAEACRLIVMLFGNCLRWFENTVHAKLISIFAKKEIHIHDIEAAEKLIFSLQIYDSDPTFEYNERQKKQLNDYLKKVLGVKKGIHATFSELLEDLDTLIENRFTSFKHVYELLKEKSLFDRDNHLIENRPKIFSSLEKIIAELTSAIHAVRKHMDRLDVMMAIKEKVLMTPPLFVTLKSDVEELRSKIDNLEYITVVIPEMNEKWYPLGIVHANDLRKQVLGTVSMRDFSNEEETKMASYLEVISVIDHHKSDIKTSLASTCVIGDAQASNTLIAELSMSLNKKYSFLGIPHETIDKQLQKISASKPKEADLKQLARLASLKLNSQKNEAYFVHPHREYVEYFCYLYAILDDTDLLTKVSNRDVECVANLLNRMKSIASKEDVEIISLDDLPKDETFVQNAASRILQNSDMYSIYKKIYAYKEQEVDSNLLACIEGKPSSIFSDTKEQNGCCRVGQTKLFSTNFPLFQKHASELRSLWLASAKKVYEAKNQVDFHLQMISTIAGADEVHTANFGAWNHQDEMWFWVPPTQQAMERLTFFLNGFLSTPAVQTNDMTVSFLGENWRELEQIFAQNFPKAKREPVNHEKPPKGLPIAVLRLKPGTMNSRKAMITPYLPRLVP